MSGNSYEVSLCLTANSTIKATLPWVTKTTRSLVPSWSMWMNLAELPFIQRTNYKWKRKRGMDVIEGWKEVRGLGGAARRQIRMALEWT